MDEFNKYKNLKISDINLSGMTLSEQLQYLTELKGFKINEMNLSTFVFSNENIDTRANEIKELTDLGIEHVLLFGVPDDEKKDCCASEAFNPEGGVQRAVRKIKEINPEMGVICDVCMCEYTSHGHCGILTESGYVHNDKTLDYLAKISLSYAQAGADMVAPSDMMDGRIKAIREALDGNGFENVAIMAYSAKYASSFYGPFREAAHSAPQFGDRKTYQMDPANTNEALIEGQLDVQEGADIIMVKPALSYLDVIQRFKDNFDLPIAAYNVSGEYSMLKLAVKEGLLNESAIYEAVMSIKRAGATIIITYFAKDIAKMLKNK